MLTKLTIERFKPFDRVEIELGKNVVFIGPNNSGKTSALQALALWDIGLKRWIEKRAGKDTPEQRPGVTINRRDLTAIPVSNAKLLWNSLRVRDVQKIDGKQRTRNILINIIVEGVTNDSEWKCGLEFDFANSESFHCRPLRISGEHKAGRMPVPDEAGGVSIAFLHPMSGIVANEFRLDPGAIQVYLGEGRTAEVLRNLCYQVVNGENGKKQWERVCGNMKDLFGISLNIPEYVSERGEITMSYVDRSGVKLDLSSAGRGLLQTLLLISFLSRNPNSLLLIDEPDAHLEILRQRQIYQMISDFVAEHGSQVIAASHSEVVLNEAAQRDIVIAFVGKPRRIDDRGHQLLKSLTEIGFDQYYQAVETGWVLYLEGSTDLAILRAFAKLLSHPACECLERPFVHYIFNEPKKARAHFHGLREAKSDLVGFTLCDRIPYPIEPDGPLEEYRWSRCEIENYLCQTETLMARAESLALELSAGPLFEQKMAKRYREVMQECIQDFVPRAAQRDPHDLWWIDTKASGDFLDRLFDQFFKKLKLPNLMRKSNYHTLAPFVPKDLLDPEIGNVLDSILEVANKACPRE